MCGAFFFIPGCNLLQYSIDVCRQLRVRDPRDLAVHCDARDTIRERVLRVWALIRDYAARCGERPADATELRQLLLDVSSHYSAARSFLFLLEKLDAQFRNESEDGDEGLERACRGSDRLDSVFYVAEGLAGTREVEDAVFHRALEVTCELYDEVSGCLSRSAETCCAGFGLADTALERYLLDCSDDEASDGSLGDARPVLVCASNGSWAAATAKCLSTLRRIPAYPVPRLDAEIIAAEMRARLQGTEWADAACVIRLTEEGAVRVPDFVRLLHRLRLQADWDGGVAVVVPSLGVKRELEKVDFFRYPGEPCIFDKLDGDAHKILVEPLELADLMQSIVSLGELCSGRWQQLVEHGPARRVAKRIRKIASLERDGDFVTQCIALLAEVRAVEWTYLLDPHEALLLDKIQTREGPKSEAEACQLVKDLQHFLMRTTLESPDVQDSHERSRCR